MEFYRDPVGKVAVLVSIGYGAGWSTWNTRELAYDKRVVELWFELGPNADERVLEERLFELGYDDVYCGGWYKISVKWVEPGSYFRIEEYDGTESLRILDLGKDYTYIPKE